MLKEHLFLHTELKDSASLASQLVPGLPVSVSQVVGLQAGLHLHACPALRVGTGKTSHLTSPHVF